MPKSRRPSRRVWAASLGRLPQTGLRQGPATGADLVDPEDPAIGHIKRAALKLIQFGFDPSDPDIAARAIEVGREEYEKDPATLARRYIRDSIETRFGLGADAPAEVVYYMRIGNRVKIGYSTSLTTRLASINPEELMATEPGDRALERLRHRQFAPLHTHGEWFRLEPLLAAHIAQVKAKKAA